MYNIRIQFPIMFQPKLSWLISLPISGIVAAGLCDYKIRLQTF